MYIKNAVRGTIIIFILSIIGGLLGYFTRVYLARNLSVTEFGLFYSVMTLFLFISYFIDSGLGYSVSRKIIELNVKGRKNKVNDLLMSVTSLQFLLSLIAAIAIMIMSNFLSTHYFHTYAGDLLILGAIWILFIPVLASYSGVFFGFQKPEYATIFETTKSSLILLASYIFIHLGYSRLSPAIANVVTNIILVVVYYFVVKKIYSGFSPSKFKFEKKISVETVKFGFVIGISNFIWLIILQIDTVVITYFLGVESVGLYQVAITVAYLLLYITTSLSSVLYPIVNELNFKKQKHKIAEATSIIYKYLMIALVPCAIILCCFAPILINLLFTPKYAGAFPALQILSIFTIFCSITMINNTLLISMGKPSKVVQTMICVAVLNLILNLILVPIYGLVGAASATLFSFVIAAILSSIELKSQIKVKFPIREWIMLLIIMVALFFESLWLLRVITAPVIMKLLLLMAIVSVTYIALIFLLRVVTVRELKDLYTLAFRK